MSVTYYRDVNVVHGVLEIAHKDTGHKRRYGMEKVIDKRYCNLLEASLKRVFKIVSIKETVKPEILSSQTNNTYRI